LIAAIIAKAAASKAVGQKPWNNSRGWRTHGVLGQQVVSHLTIFDVDVCNGRIQKQQRHFTSARQMFGFVRSGCWLRSEEAVSLRERNRKRKEKWCIGLQCAVHP